MSALLFPSLLFLSIGPFPQYDHVQDDDSFSPRLLGNNLEVSLEGKLDSALALLGSARQLTISLQTKFKSSRVQESFQPNSIHLVFAANTTFSESLQYAIASTRLNGKVTFVQWPSVCANKSEAAQMFSEHAAHYFTDADLSANVYVMFRIQNGRSNDSVSVAIWEAYSVAGNVLKNEVELESRESLNWFSLNNKIVRRMDSRQAVLRAISVNDPGWENETKYRERQVNETYSEGEFAGGYAVDMLWVIQDLFNFRIRAMYGNWTGITEGGNGSTWLVGNGRTVADGGADISISQQALNLGYFQHNLFLLHPTNSAGLRLYFIQPEMSQYRDIFVTPFERNLWITIICVFGLMILTVKFFGWVLTHYAENDDANNKELVDSVVVWSVAVLAQQGFHIEPSSLSIRVVFLFGYMTGLVVFIAYSAQIVSTLSVKSVPIHRAEDVLNGPFHLYANPNNTPKSVINHILKERKRSNESVFMEERDAIRRIVTFPQVMQALVAEPDIFYTEATALKCSTTVICEMLSSLRLHRVPIKGGMFVGRNSPYKEWFNYAIILMLERGLNHRFVSNYMRRSWVSCLDERSAYVQAVKVTDILSAFKILFVGMATSLVLLILEIVIVNRNRLFIGRAVSDKGIR